MVFFIATAVSLVVAISVWGRRFAVGAVFLALLDLTVTQWAFTSGFEAAAVNLSAKIIWAKISFVIIAFAPLFYFLFAIQFGQKRRWVSPGTIAVLALIPVLTVFIAATDNWHHLLWRTILLQPQNNTAIYRPGQWFWVSFIYNYAMLGVGAYYLCRALFLFHVSYRARFAYLLVGTAMPIAGYSAYALGLIPEYYPNFVPITFALTGIVLTWGIYKQPTFSLIPTARNQMVESMRDGVLVVDESNQIVDINQSAEKMLVIKGRYHIGEPVQDILPIWDGLTANIGEKDVTTEISVGDHDPRVIEVHISPLYNQRQRFIGRLVALHDITTKKQISDALDKANQNLKLQITEIEALQADLQEQAVRDHLTGLVNRRFLEETLDGELPRAVRKGYPVCIALIDLDHLKGLNDKHGHAAGDAMLQAVGKLLQKKTRQGDFVCRYGGDEFVVVFPDATIPTAYKRIEQLRAACEDFEVKYGEESLSLSLTAGIAAFPQHGSTAGEVLHHADQALYQAKSAGRNCIMVWGEAIAVTVA